MKRIIFVIIASLLVLGIVLPGCGGPTPPPPTGNLIKIAVIGPMNDIQGQNHWAGAQMAKDAINNAGGVLVGNTTYNISLVQVETFETTTGSSGTTGQTNLLAVINDVNFVVGGFRTEAVQVYREVAMDAGKIFFNCGAATASLQASTISNYSRYQYWFKSTPYNEVFLVTSMLKMTGLICGTLNATLAGLEAANSTWVKDDYKISLAGGKPKVHIVAENLAWCAGIVALAQAKLPALGYNVTGTSLVSQSADQVTMEGVLNTAYANRPHIFFTAFSGACGASYSLAKGALNMTGLTIGINVPGQEKAHWTTTAGKCDGEIFLDTWAENLSVNTGTVAWFNSFVAATTRYPGYTAATYDAIYAIKEVAQAAGTITNATVLIPYFEALNRTTGVGTPGSMVYPLAATNLGGGVLALNQTQKEALYGTSWAYNVTQWTTLGGHIRHDTVYGPGYQTGIGSQWQNGTKVGIWPMYLNVPSQAYWDGKLTDQYGNWNFQYPGTKLTSWAKIMPGFLNCPVPGFCS